MMEGMSKKFTVCGVEVSSVDPNQEWFKALQTVDFVPAPLNPKYVPVPESFVYTDDRTFWQKGEEQAVFAWTENTLRLMDRFGISFPVSVSLHGPIMLPSKYDASVAVPVWYSTGFNWNGGWDIRAAVTRIGDEFMAGTLAYKLSFEDRRFLATHYPIWRSNAPKGYVAAVHERLREGVPKSELAKWDGFYD